MCSVPKCAPCECLATSYAVAHPSVASVVRMSPRHDATEREAHLARFGQVSATYPHIVAQAYGGDLAAAQAATDQQVADQVRAWEVEQGREPGDWVAIGAAEPDFETS